MPRRSWSGGVNTARVGGAPRVLADEPPGHAQEVVELLGQVGQIVGVYVELVR